MSRPTSTGQGLFLFFVQTPRPPPSFWSPPLTLRVMTAFAKIAFGLGAPTSHLDENSRPKQFRSSRLSSQNVFIPKHSHPKTSLPKNGFTTISCKLDPSSAGPTLSAGVLKIPFFVSPLQPQTSFFISSLGGPFVVLWPRFKAKVHLKCAFGVPCSHCVKPHPSGPRDLTQFGQMRSNKVGLTRSNQVWPNAVTAVRGTGVRVRGSGGGVPKKVWEKGGRRGGLGERNSEKSGTNEQNSETSKRRTTLAHRVVLNSCKSHWRLNRSGPNRFHLFRLICPKAVLTQSALTHCCHFLIKRPECVTLDPTGTCCSIILGTTNRRCCVGGRVGFKN